jgi:hypothetical protein
MLASPAGEGDRLRWRGCNYADKNYPTHNFTAEGILYQKMMFFQKKEIFLENEIIR